MTEQEIETLLDRQRRKAKKFDIALVFMMLVGLSVFVYIGWNITPEAETTTRVICAVFGFLAYFPVMRLADRFDQYARKRWFYDYIIEERDGVRRLHGSVGVTDNRFHKNLLRPGFKMYHGDTVSVYGVAFAAIKMNQTDFETKEKLASMDVNSVNRFG